MTVPDESHKAERDNLRQEKFIQFRYRIAKKEKRDRTTINVLLILLSFDNSPAEFGTVVAPATNHLGCN